MLKQIIKKSDNNLVSQLEKIRNSQQGIITYVFESEKFIWNKNKNEYDVVVNKWTQQQSINPKIFYDNKGRNETLSNIADIFKSTAWDLGAKYFTL